MLGAIGKSRSASELMRIGYHVYQEYDGKSPVDLLAYDADKDSVLKVECKSTKTRSRNDTGWVVQLKSVRANTKGNRLVPFNNKRCDLLAIYIEPTDEVIIINSSEINSKSSILVSDKLIDNII